MRHFKHKYWVPGVPIWSQFTRYPQLYCETCRMLFVDKYIYLICFIIYQIKNYKNHLLRLGIKLKVIRHEKENGIWVLKPFFKR
jgi:hypothetical protein